MRSLKHFKVRVGAQHRFSKKSTQKSQKTFAVFNNFKVRVGAQHLFLNKKVPKNARFP